MKHCSSNVKRAAIQNRTIGDRPLIFSETLASTSLAGRKCLKNRTSARVYSTIRGQRQLFCETIHPDPFISKQKIEGLEIFAVERV